MAESSYFTRSTVLTVFRGTIASQSTEIERLKKESGGIKKGAAANVNDDEQKKSTEELSRLKAENKELQGTTETLRYIKIEKG